MPVRGDGGSGIPLFAGLRATHKSVPELSDRLYLVEGIGMLSPDSYPLAIFRSWIASKPTFSVIKKNTS